MRSEEEIAAMQTLLMEHVIKLRCTGRTERLVAECEYDLLRWVRGLPSSLDDLWDFNQTDKNCHAE